MDLVLSLAALQAVILSIAIFSNRSLAQSKVYLSFILSLSAIALYGRVQYQPSFILEYQYFFALPDALLFMFGPLSFFFVSTILNRPIVLGKWPHFLPAIFNATIINTIVGASIATTRIPWVSDNLGILFTFIELGGIVSCASYIFLSVKALKNEEKPFLEKFSNPLPLNFVKGYLITFSVLVVLWFVGFLLSRLGVSVSSISVYDAFWVASCFSIYLFTYYYLNYQRTFQSISPITSNAILAPTQLEALKSKLSEVMTKEQPYLKSDVNIETLAQLAGMKRHHLSEVINKGYRASFFDFINRYRINYYINHYQENSGLTFIQAAFDSGFNSKTAFNRAFKKETGKTPSSYFNSPPTKK